MIEKTNKFIIGRIKSFKYAFKGLFYMLKTQPNILIHLFVGIIVIIFGIYFKITTTEWLFVILTIAMVLITEIINTAIEEIVNLISPSYNKQAGLIKDLAAAFVLLSAIFAIVVGLIIFLPKFINPQYS